MDLNKKFGWQDIEGWFGFQQIYDAIIREAAQNDQLIEVGSGPGRSTCYLASRAKLSGKALNITAVDRFGEKLYRKFVENMTKAGVVDLISIIPLSTSNAAQVAYENSIFAVFAIGRQTPMEIQTWYSKVRPGGIIGGCGPAPKDMKCKTWKGKDDIWSAWTMRKA